MPAMHKYLIQLQKICSTRTRVVFFVAILTTVLVLVFHSLIVSPGDGSTAVFAVLGQTSLLSRSASGSPPSNDRRNSFFPPLVNGEEDRDLAVDVPNGTRLGKLNGDHGNETTENSEKPVSSSGSPLRGDPLPGEKEKKKRKRRGKLDEIQTVSSEGRDLIEECILAKDRQERARLRQYAMSISDMDQLVSKNRESCSVVPRWFSPRDREILDARKQIQSAPPVKTDPELYPPVFRNFSMFKRSYDLMERLLKIYIYREGEKPIFHEPELIGIYSSEGWFMKHMQGSSRFLVDDPSEAHLFYMPFGSHHLQQKLYVPDSHSHDNLIEFLQNYVSTIAAKYPFWNRTDGADHFLASCHDWSTHETWRAMGTSVRALCNADTTEDFVVGKDVSLPETNVQSLQDPARNLGGRSAKKRTLLAFFAGQMHGYLRPSLVQHWGNDTDMVILGPMQRSKSKKLDYAEYMRTSRFCICPRGFEVNSPRVVEAIFYECVPVLISDNFVPPFFEVLDWKAFAVIVEEKEVPSLKEILLSIPRRRYAALRTGVRRVQRHFLWHAQPVKYDLFHMILHSIWFNRLFQLKSDDNMSTLG